ncbi:hypothetical protein MBLNU230_g0059t1 [Neophaeotheca triangularis]
MTIDIKHARRLLVLGPPNCGSLDVLEDLTGNAPAPNPTTSSTAGLTHEWHLKTQYYNATIPIWVDEISDLETWKNDFMKEEAKEVVEAVGAWVYCFRQSSDGRITQEVENALRAIMLVREEHAGYAEDAALLAVAVPGAKDTSKLTEEVAADCEDACLQYGFEYVDLAAEGKNEFGEKVGLERLREALEANEWTAGSGADDLDDLTDPLEGKELGGIGTFGHEEAEMTAELFGMKAALIGGDDEPEPEPDAELFEPALRQKDEVDDLDRMMGKLLAVKEQGADLPEAQRKRMAAKAVKELMEGS